MSKNLSAMESDDKENPSSTPFFSIGVTTYNRPELLKQTLASITMQTFSDFEVIVGNDFIQEPLSAATLDIRDSRIRIVNHPHNLGEVRNMNALIDLGRGRYFTWQTDDDLYAPNFLEDVHSALVKFDFPPCVFTSFEFIQGASFPDVEKTPSGQGQTFSGRQFLRKYWSGKLKAMGCSGVYDKKHLKRIGGVESLADTSFALYSEHLLLVRAGLLEQVAYIDEPLVKYRVHEDSWGCTAKDLLLYKQASGNLIRESAAIFSHPELRDDFRQNMASVLEFVVKDFFTRLRMKGGILTRFEAFPYLLSLKKQFSSLKGSDLYWEALLSWVGIGARLTWWLGTII
jgi:glycosyltransferase involved in cell wall biosynthesis